MEQHEIALIEQHVKTDMELKSLWEQHQEYERQLVALEGKSSLSQVEEVELKELKKKKLAGKTQLQKLINQYSTGE